MFLSAERHKEQHRSDRPSPPDSYRTKYGGVGVPGFSSPLTSAATSAPHQHVDRRVRSMEQYLSLASYKGSRKSRVLTHNCVMWNLTCRKWKEPHVATSMPQTANLTVTSWWDTGGNWPLVCEAQTCQPLLQTKPRGSIAKGRPSDSRMNPLLINLKYHVLCHPTTSPRHNTVFSSHCSWVGQQIVWSRLDYIVCVKWKHGK